MAEGGTERGWAGRNRMLLLCAGLVVAYGATVQWAWGWPSILEGWRQVGFARVALALALLVATYFVRAHRIQDYFPRETKGGFVRLFRLTQIHNILNIMLPFRTGETSFPLLMRSQFGVPLAHGTSALLVLRLLDLHALLAAAGIGLVAQAGYGAAAWLAWLAFLLAPLALFPLRGSLLSAGRKRLGPGLDRPRLARLVDEIGDGIPGDLGTFLRAWALTAFNWAVKILVLAWVLGLMGVGPVAATFGGAVGGELSSVLPVHAPAGIGTYPAGIAAGAAAFGADRGAASLESLARAAINAHLLTMVGALAGLAVGLLIPAIKPQADGR
jgi:uncharacterized membrane protein YbhN (UPF0104 family)